MGHLIEIQQFPQAVSLAGRQLTRIGPPTSQGAVTVDLACSGADRS
jgi:hypothetical protein